MSIVAKARINTDIEFLPETQTLNRLGLPSRFPLGPASLPAAAAIEFLRLMRVTFDAVTGEPAVGAAPAAGSGDTFFQQLCRSAGVAIIGTDTEFRICFWNPMAEKVFGGPAEQRRRQSLMELFPPARRETARQLLESSLIHVEVNELEFEHLTPSGEEVQLAANISPIRDDVGHVRGLAVFVRNVTRRVMLQREMLKSQRMSALGGMAGAVAHHFNNVLGGIITSIDFAQESDNPQTLRRVLKNTVAAVSRANKLTLGLLAFAEGDSTDPAAAEIHQTVRNFVNELLPRLKSRNIFLETDLSPVTAIMPVKRICTILDNLTANACEAMPSGGRLTLQLVQEHKEIVLRVSDTGTGLPAEAANRLFEPFFTTKTGTSRDDHIGLGLAVVHGLVRQLGGTADLTSKPSDGTTCTIRLPMPRA